MKTLETERMILRPFTMEDLEDFYQYCKMETVGPNAGWTPHKNRDESKRIIEGFIEKGDVLAIYHRQDQLVVGSVGLHKKQRSDGTVYHEVGYVLSTPYEGQGLMTEAVKRLLEYAFLDLNLPYLAVCHFVSNDKSRRVIEKCHFRFMGIGEHPTVSYGVRKSMEYELTREQYLKTREEQK